MTPRSPDLVQIHCEALGKGLWDGDPGPLTHTSQSPAIHVRTAACRPAAPIVSAGTIASPPSLPEKKQLSNFPLREA